MYNLVDIKRLMGKAKGFDVFVVGTGPSLNGFDFSELENRFVIALNHAIDFFPDGPSMHIFSDVALCKFWKKSKRASHTLVVCQSGARDQLNNSKVSWRRQMCVFRRTPKGARTVKLEDADLFVANTVACGAIQLCWKMGAERVFLLGVDGYRTNDMYYADGSKYPKGERPAKRVEEDGRIVEERHVRFERNMNELKSALHEKGAYTGSWPASSVYNLSPTSTIKTWDRLDFRRSLSGAPFRNVVNGNAWFLMEQTPMVEEEREEVLEDSVEENASEDPEVVSDNAEVEESEEDPVVEPEEEPEPEVEEEPVKEDPREEKILGVITPTRDRHRALELCSEWLSRQTYRNFSWCVVDDGDVKAGRPKNADEYLERPSSDKNMTLVANFLAGLRACQDFEYIALVEDDDWRDKDYLRSLMDGIQGFDVCFVAGFKLYNVRHRKYSDRRDSPERILSKGSGTGSFNAVFRGPAIGYLYRVLEEDNFTAKGFWSEIWKRFKVNCISTEMVTIKGIKGRSFGPRHKAVEGMSDPDGKKLVEWVGKKDARKLLGSAQ
jgi:hypothetical protein